MQIRGSKKQYSVKCKYDPFLKKKKRASCVCLKGEAQKRVVKCTFTQVSVKWDFECGFHPVTVSTWQKLLSSVYGLSAFILNIPNCCNTFHSGFISVT